MAEWRDLAPAELDRLEDALEQLEVFGVPDELRARAEDGAIVDRLEAYRVVLERTRESMPLVDVPTGLLDGVLAESRHGAVAAAAPKTSLWKRLRLTIVMPALAFAGAAALLVVIVRQDELATADTASTVARAPESDAPARKADASPGLIADASRPKPEVEAAAELAPGDVERGLAAQPTTEDRARADKRESEENAADDTTLEERLGRATGGSAPATKAKKPTSSTSSPNKDPWDGDEKKQDKGKGEIEDAPKEAPPPPAAPKAEPKPVEPAQPAPGASPQSGGDDVGWSTIEQADSQRRAGKCGLARVKYEQAKKAIDAKIRARALAGIGLCERAEGHPDVAEKLFAQARAQDPKVDAFIAGEKN